VNEWVRVRCPYCGEELELTIEPDLLGKLVQDCEVCCQPCELVVTRDEWGDPEVAIERLSG
jgi:hypothetical protein